MQQNLNGEYVLLAEDGANIIMRNYPVAYLTQGKFWLNNHAHIMRMRNGSNYFLVQVLEKIDYKKYNTGTAQPKLNSKIVKNIELKIPHIEEQQQIGNFFKQLDDIIALHQRKLDLLKETKKGFLQKMFPKNGAKVPEIRFPGFTGDWEQCKLGDIAKMYQPPTISGSELLDTGYPVFGANGYIGFYSKSNHLEDQVTISARGEGTGTPSYVKAPVWITGNSMVINVEDFDINKKFLYAMLLSYSLKKYITGGAQPQLTRDVLLKVPIIIPSYNEQFKIGTFFKQLDDTIALQQRKLDLLKETKKGFLQKMFV
ncbi:restriction endonuclease subunit S [Enterococcus faecalis]|nr:restriction endonuclease subunit S [Enterococcus faecalis]MCS5459414.1 restriction endonuclease subunit S [Enterococcus faecalis]